MTKTIKGYFVKYRDKYYGPVTTKEKVEQLAVYTVGKNEGSFDDVVICEGEIALHPEGGIATRQNFTELYKLDLKNNPHFQQQKLLNDIIEEARKNEKTELGNS